MAVKSKERENGVHQYTLFGCVATILLFLVVTLCNVRADDASLGAVGYGVIPLQNDQVIMAAERVEAEIRGDESWVTCVFTFTNTGTATRLLMGFPQAQARQGGVPELLDFRAFVDGEETPVTFRPNAQPEGEWDYAGWHTFIVPFAAGQTRTVRNTYHGRLTWLSNGGRLFEYILHTGAAWRGPIGQADILVRWDKDRDVAPETISASPPGYLQGKRELRWHFTNLEPTVEDDIRVSFRPVYGPHNLGTATASSGQVQPPHTGYSLPAALFSDDDPTTAWQAEGEAGRAWVIWSYHNYPHYASPTLGLGLLPGVAGDINLFRAHGRPKEVLVRLAHWKENGEAPPIVAPIPESFLHPLPQLEVTEHHLSLEDAPRWQFLRLEKPATVLAFQVVVERVYPGECYDDVAIAEVRFPLLDEDMETAALAPGTGAEMPTSLSRSWGKVIWWVMAIIVAALLLVIILLVRHRSQLRSQSKKKEKNR